MCLSETKRLRHQLIKFLKKIGYWSFTVKLSSKIKGAELSNEIFRIPGYHIYSSCDGQANNAYSGIAIIIKKRIRQSHLIAENLNYLETPLVTIRDDKRKLKILAAYKQPTKDRIVMILLNSMITYLNFKNTMWNRIFYKSRYRKPSKGTTIYNKWWYWSSCCERTCLKIKKASGYLLSRVRCLKPFYGNVQNSKINQKLVALYLS